MRKLLKKIIKFFSSLREIQEFTIVKYNFKGMFNKKVCLMGFAKSYFRPGEHLLENVKIETFDFKFEQKLDNKLNNTVSLFSIIAVVECLISKENSENNGILKTNLEEQDNYKLPLNYFPSSKRERCIRVGYSTKEEKWAIDIIHYNNKNGITCAKGSRLFKIK